MLKVGDTVIIGKHTSLDIYNNYNWENRMDAYVGKTAKITQICFAETLKDGRVMQLYFIDLDNCDSFWREEALTPLFFIIAQSVPKNMASGAFCKRCNNYNEYAEKNYTCWSCRH